MLLFEPLAAPAPCSTLAKRARYLRGERREGGGRRVSMARVPLRLRYCREPDARPSARRARTLRFTDSEKLPREFSMPGTAGQPPQLSWLPGTTETGKTAA